MQRRLAGEVFQVWEVPQVDVLLFSESAHMSACGIFSRRTQRRGGGRAQLEEFRHLLF